MGKEKEMQIDQLLQRLTAVQHQLSVGVAGHWPAGGMVPPTFTMEQAPIAAAASAAAASAAGKKAKTRVPKTKPGKASTASQQSAAAAASLRAEAPEFVPVVS